MTEEIPPPHPHSIYLMRTVQQQHVTLSAMADQKANMLLGVASVVLALVVREGTLAGLRPPVLVLAGSSFIAALCCMLAVVPAIGRPRAPKSEVLAEPNILFFGVFAELSEEEYLARMRKIMASDTAIYAAMVRDVHQQGMLLKRKKYFFLGWAYRVFIAGLVLTFFTFLIDMAL